MRKIVITSFLFTLAACTYDPNTGDNSFHPLVLSRPDWAIGKQNANGQARFCSLSAGEVTVALKNDGHELIQQVNISTPVVPGDTYNMQIGSRHYDTKQEWFTTADSDAIIGDMLGSQGYMYTELFKFNAANHDMRRNNQSNKIPLAGFAGQYQACKSYVQAGK